MGLWVGCMVEENILISSLSRGGSLGLLIGTALSEGHSVKFLLVDI